jgi:hypothetical protein
MSLMVDPTVQPKAVHKPVPIPVHWMQPVKAGLDRNVRLSLVYKVPVGTAVMWCSCMVVVAKSDGSSRCTVDLQALR